MIALPLRDDSPRRQMPWVVLTLLILNVAVFLLLQPASLQQGKVDAADVTAEERRELGESYSEWGAVPCEIRGLQLRSEGARCTSDAERPIIDDKSILATLVTHLFLHGSLAHLVVNMLFLWIFGAAVEERFGPGAFLGIYLLTGVLGTLTYVAANPGSAAPVIGASGAIAGIMGAFLLIGPRRRLLTFVAPLPLVVLALPAWALLGPYLLSQVTTPDDAAVAWQAHVGGMIVGVILAFGLVLLDGINGRRRRRAEVDSAPLDPTAWHVPDRPPVEA